MRRTEREGEGRRRKEECEGRKDEEREGEGRRMGQHEVVGGRRKESEGEGRSEKEDWKVNEGK